MKNDSILLVDDDATNLALLHEALKGGDYRLLVAKNGEQALNIVSRMKPTLVLLDIMMPGMDGYETLKRIKELPEAGKPAVIFLSALDKAGDKVKGLELGAVDYIPKPFDAREVIARVDTHLKIARLERNLTEKNQQLEQANRRMSADLKAAANVQRAYLPQSLPKTDLAHFVWRYRPCQELAGDHLNIIHLDEQHIALYVMDVCGHGISSSLLAVSVARQLNKNETSVMYSEDGNIASPAEIAHKLNGNYPMSANAGLYFTLTYGVLNTVSNEFHFVSAGNHGPIVCRAAGEVSVHEAPAVPIGLLSESTYGNSFLTLAAGDRLYLYTDGLVEERNRDGEQFGRERIVEIFAKKREHTLGQSIDTAINEVIGWRGGHDLRDDIAVLAAGIKKAG